MQCLSVWVRPGWDTNHEGFECLGQARVGHQPRRSGPDWAPTVQRRSRATREARSGHQHVHNVGPDCAPSAPQLQALAAALA